MRTLLAGLLLLAAAQLSAQPPAEPAWLRLQQRDYAGVQAMLAAMDSTQPAQAALLALAVQYRRDGQLDEAALSAL